MTTRSTYSSNLNQQTSDGDGKARAKALLDANIEKLWALEDGWQGPDSVAPGDAAKKFFEEYWDGLASSYWTESTPSATAEGGLHMEWDRDTRHYAADILPRGELQLTVTAPSKADNAELLVAEPTTAMLRRFVMRGLPLD
jgi:hypothetical protein